MLIRQETVADHGQIYTLIKDAFATAEHAGGNEQELVNALRRGKAYVPELALVAEISGKLAGHILFTRATVGSSEVLVLAPLSVPSAFQRQGVGAALIREGHRIARALGYSYSFVLGSERYYPRFGYVPAEQLGVDVPQGIPSVNFMAIPLQEAVPPLRGSIVYAEEFGI